MSNSDPVLKWAVRAYLASLKEYKDSAQTLKRDLYTIDAEKTKLYIR